MRALFVIANGGYSHFYPVLPLARELTRRGHQVAVAAPAHLTKLASDLGFEAIELAPAPVAQPVTSLTDAPPSVQRARTAVGKYLDDAVFQLDALQAAVRDWGPDVLVRESAAWSAWLAGELLDLPVASFDYAPTPARLLSATLGDLFASARERAGLPPDPTLASLSRWLHILVGPPEWFPARAITPVTHIFQPVSPADPDCDLPQWLDELDDSRPCVYVTLGTMFHRTPGIRDAIFTAVCDEPVQVVITLGPGAELAEVDTTPANVRVESFVPQAVEEALLTRSDAVICHGGYGSLLSALRHGLPIVSMSIGNADDPTRLPGLAKLGAGVVIGPNDQNPQSIKQTLRLVLTDSKYRIAARKAAASLTVLPAFTECATLVERLAAERMPQTRA